MRRWNEWGDNGITMELNKRASHLRRDRHGIFIPVQSGCDSCESVERREYSWRLDERIRQWRFLCKKHSYSRLVHKVYNQICHVFCPSQRGKTMPETAMRHQNGPFSGVFTWQIGLKALWDKLEKLLYQERFDFDIGIREYRGSPPLPQNTVCSALSGKPN